MNIDRRDFFKVVFAGAATALTAPTAQARPPKELSPDAVGILYDATLCIGCKACEVECKAANAMPMSHDTPLEQAYGVSGLWDSGNDLNSQNLNKIKLYTNGTAEVKDRELDGYSFVKRNCMHCVDPNCVSACPVSALTKDPMTGAVTYNPDACIGCRYCQLACPFNIPKFEYDKAFPKIVKCEMCSERLAEGDIPACCEACPTGASLFGRVSDLLKEGHRRLTFQPGDWQDYPMHRLGGCEIRMTEVTGYYPKVYGETETGGTQYLLMAGVPFEKLGLPALGDDSRARLSETIQHTVYHGMMAPTLLLGGLVYAAYRHTHEEREDPSADQDRTETNAEERRHD
jgi:Fe-S-cluster-containing dehydrogenase component